MGHRQSRVFVTQSSRPGAAAFRRTLDMRDGHPAALLRPAESSGGYDAPPPSVPMATGQSQMRSDSARQLPQTSRIEALEVDLAPLFCHESNSLKFGRILAQIGDVFETNTTKMGPKANDLGRSFQV